MDNIENKVESSGFSFGCVYKYITYYGGGKGIIVIGSLDIDNTQLYLNNPMYIKFELPTGRRRINNIKKDPVRFEICKNALDRLNKLNKKEYLIYSIVKKI